MLVIEKLNIIQKTFVFMGLAPVEKKTGQIGLAECSYTNVLHSIPVVFSFTVTLLQLIVQLTFFEDASYGRIHMFILNVYFLIIATSNIVANIKCLFYKREYFDIVQRIHDIHSIFAVKCERDVNYQRFIKIYRIKFFITFFLWIAMATSSYVINAYGPFSEFILTTVTIVLESISFMSCMHAILFIDHVHLFAKEMNGILVNRKSYFQTTAMSKRRVKNILKVKCLHFEIWKLVQQINDFFGWLFVTLFIKYLVDIIYDLYWIFMEFEQTTGWKATSLFGRCDEFQRKV